MLTGAIIGGIVGLLVVILTFFIKEQRFNKLLRTVKDPGLEYAELYHYASQDRYQKSFKFFDAYGIFYIIGDIAYFKTKDGATPMQFNLRECVVQAEPNWRMLKWFSITTPTNEKYYFDSHKMGGFKNNSDETLKGLAIAQSKSKKA